MSAKSTSLNSVRASIDVPLNPAEAFAIVCEELASGLATLGIRFEPGAEAHVVEGTTNIGRVIAWEPGQRFTIEWRPASWRPELVTYVELRFEPVDDKTVIILEHRGWGKLIGDGGELAGWFTREVALPLFGATTPKRFGDWFTDRSARRPSGASSRNRYRDPLYHYAGFRVILEEFALTADDYLLDVGSGGGAFLKMALRSGCRAAGVDHSPEMVRLACGENRDAIAEGRLKIVEASASVLPFANETFSCATMHGVLGFLPDPISALREIHRVLRRDGRLVLLGTDPELKDSPACPEPISSRLRFYDEETLLRLGHDSGFDGVRVLRQNLASYAREAGVPEEHLALFAGHDARILIARKG